MSAPTEQPAAVLPEIPDVVAPFRFCWVQIPGPSKTTVLDITNALDELMIPSRNYIHETCELDWEPLTVVNIAFYLDDQPSDSESWISYAKRIVAALRGGVQPETKAWYHVWALQGAQWTEKSVLDCIRDVDHPWPYLRFPEKVSQWSQQFNFI
ncbi:hypothetical protein VTK73DRAFT_4875 [Phialemonium thermophilum]|uniref:Uncharacterized protein n=1 Tax=Phialemonium thermophilum TaxID=223376 RepID=A0ABR3WRT1_9PEZI